MPLWALLCGLFVAQASWHGALAQSRSARVLLVRPSDRELVTRVQGQTRDLGITLEVVDGANVAARGGAERLARAKRARFVAQVSRSARGLEVRLYDAQQRVWRRRSVPALDPSEHSAELEAAALLLRGELSSCLAGEPPEEPASSRSAPAVPSTGTAAGSSGPPSARSTASTDASAAPSARSSAPAAASAAPSARSSSSAAASDGASRAVRPTAQRAAPSRAAPDVEAEDDAPEEPDEPGPDLAARSGVWNLRAGLRLSTPVADELALSPQLGARVQLGWLDLGVAASSSLPYTVERGPVSLGVRRHALVAEALAAWPWERRFRVLAGIAAGVVLSARRTESALSPFLATSPSTAWSAALAAQVELQWLATRHFGVSASAGLETTLPRTHFVAREDTNEMRDLASLRALEPWGLLAIFAVIGD